MPRVFNSEFTRSSLISGRLIGACLNDHRRIRSNIFRALTTNHACVLDSFCLASRGTSPSLRHYLYTLCAHVTLYDITSDVKSSDPGYCR